MGLTGTGWFVTDWLRTRKTLNIANKQRRKYRNCQDSERKTVKMEGNENTRKYCSCNQL